MQNAKRYSWVVVFLLWTVALLNYLDRQMLSTMKPSMQIDIHELQTATNFGYLMAVFLWIYGLFSPFSGMIADKINRKWIIVASLFVWSTVTFLMGFAETFNQLYFLRALMGISEALYMPAGLSLLVDYHPKDTRSLAVGIHMTGFYIGQALGGFGATIANTLSWRKTFEYFGIAGIIYSIIILFFLKEIRTTKSSNKPAAQVSDILNKLKSIFSNYSYLLVLVSFAFVSIPGWAFKNWLPTLFSYNLKLDMSVAGPIATITLAFSSLIGVVTGGIVSDKWIDKNYRGRVYTSIIGLILIIPSLLLIGFGDSLPMIIGAAFCFGIGYGMFDANYMPVLCQFVAPEKRATANGCMNMVAVFLGAVITNVLGKSMDAGHLGRDFSYLALVIVFVVVIQFLFLKPGTADFKE